MASSPEYEHNKGVDADPSEIQGQSPWRSEGRVKPPEAESFVAFERQKEMANLLSSLYFATLVGLNDSDLWCAVLYLN